MIRLLAMDVDGVLTDGAIIYDSTGVELKHFHVSDGLGIVILKQVGITVAWLSARENTIVERRAAELQVSYILQGTRNKGQALQELSEKLNVKRSDIAYIGDDWNDLPAFEAAGIRIAVSNAAPEILAAADIVTARPGGHGAVREVCERLLDARGQRATCLQAYLKTLAGPNPTNTPVQ